MPELVLAGDIGGTKTVVALYAIDGPRSIRVVREATFPSRSYAGLEAVAAEFLKAGGEKVAGAAFGIAGPVVDEAVRTTNLPWVVEAKSLAAFLDCPRVRLMNDLESTAYGAIFLRGDELRTLHEGKPRPGNVAVIAAGTGLGQGCLFWDAERARHVPVATEGGHADFAPRDDVEIELLRFLRALYGRVSYERILSGPGLHNLFRFFDEVVKKPVSPSVRERLKSEDPGAVIGEAGTAGECAACEAAVDLFVSLYGAQAGNLALAVLAVGGVYVGGGIVVKMIAKMLEGSFFSSFVAKGRYETLLRDVPVRIITNPKTSLVGAAHAAAELVS
jgi:glucokinase